MRPGQVSPTTRVFRITAVSIYGGVASAFKMKFGMPLEIIPVAKSKSFDGQLSDMFGGNKTPRDCHFVL